MHPDRLIPSDVIRPLMIGVAVGISVVFSIVRWSPLFTVSIILLAVATIALRREVIQGRLTSPTALYCALTIVHFAIPGLLFAGGFYFFVANENRASADVAQLYVLLSFLAFVLGDQIISGNRRACFRNSIPCCVEPQKGCRWSDSVAYRRMERAFLRNRAARLSTDSTSNTRRT